MRKLFFSIVALFALVGLGVAQPAQPQLVQPVKPAEIDPLDKMPILQHVDDAAYKTAFPIEQRGQEFRKYLSASVKIGIQNGIYSTSGSATIVYYDSNKNIAYLASCGHLWDEGMMDAATAAKYKKTVKVIVWYHNDVKLPAPKTYTGTMIFYSNRMGCDTSLITFQPDWIPEYFPIAPLNYEIKPQSRQHSLGCDAGSEVAHYDVEIIGMQGSDLVTRYNSPRPGRSGGGLMTEDGYYIGTCWGTSRKDGSGVGYFTSLPVIHSFWAKNGYGWLCEISPQAGGNSIARQIPIVDKNNPQGDYKPEYILLPKSK